MVPGQSTCNDLTSSWGMSRIASLACACNALRHLHRGSIGLEAPDARLRVCASAMSRLLSRWVRTKGHEPPAVCCFTRKSKVDARCLGLILRSAPHFLAAESAISKHRVLYIGRCLQGRRKADRLAGIHSPQTKNPHEKRGHVPLNSSLTGQQKSNVF